MFSADLMCHLFNILVRCLRLFRIHHVNVMIAHRTSGAAFDLVGIKYKDQPHLPVSLKIAENVHKLSSRAVQTDLRQIL